MLKLWIKILLMVTVVAAITGELNQDVDLFNEGFTGDGFFAEEPVALFGHGYVPPPEIRQTLAAANDEAPIQTIDMIFPKVVFQKQPFFRIWTQNQKCDKNAREVKGAPGVFTLAIDGRQSTALMMLMCNLNSNARYLNQLSMSYMCVDQSHDKGNHNRSTSFVTLWSMSSESIVEKLRCGNQIITILPNGCAEGLIATSWGCMTTAVKIHEYSENTPIAGLGKSLCFIHPKRNIHSLDQASGNSRAACICEFQDTTYFDTAINVLHPSLSCFPPRLETMQRPNNRLVNDGGSLCPVTKLYQGSCIFLSNLTSCELATSMDSGVLSLHVRGTGMKVVSITYGNKTRHESCGIPVCTYTVGNVPHRSAGTLIVSCNNKLHHFHVVPDRTHMCPHYSMLAFTGFSEFLCKFSSTPWHNAIFWMWIFLSPVWFIVIVKVSMMIFKPMMRVLQWCEKQLMIKTNGLKTHFAKCPSCQCWVRSSRIDVHYNRIQRNECCQCGTFASLLHMGIGCPYRPYLSTVPLPRDVAKAVTTTLCAFATFSVSTYVVVMLLLTQPIGTLGSKDAIATHQQLEQHYSGILNMNLNCTAYGFDGQCADKSLLSIFDSAVGSNINYQRWAARMHKRQLDGHASTGPSWCTNNVNHSLMGACMHLGFSAPSLRDLSIPATDDSTSFTINTVVDEAGHRSYEAFGEVSLDMNGPHVIELTDDNVAGMNHVSIKVMLLKSVRVYQPSFKYISYPYLVHHLAMSTCQVEDQCKHHETMEGCSVWTFIWSKARDWGCNPAWCWDRNSGEDCFFLAAIPEMRGDLATVFSLDSYKLATQICIVIQDQVFSCRIMTDGSEFQLGPISIHASIRESGSSSYQNKLVTLLSPMRSPAHVDFVSVGLPIMEPGYGSLGDLGVPQSKFVNMSAPCWHQKQDNHFVRWPAIQVDRVCHAMQFPIITAQNVPQSPLIDTTNLRNLYENLLGTKLKVMNPRWKSNHLAVDGFLEEDQGFGAAQFSIHVHGLKPTVADRKALKINMTILACHGCYGCDVGFECLVKVYLKSSTTLVTRVTSTTAGVYLEGHSKTITPGVSTIVCHGKSAYNHDSAELCLETICVTTKLNLTMPKNTHYVSYENYNTAGIASQWCSECYGHRSSVLQNLINDILTMPFGLGQLLLGIVITALVILIIVGLFKLTIIVWKSKPVNLCTRKRKEKIDEIELQPCEPRLPRQMPIL